MPSEPIRIERRGKYLIARHAGVITAYKITWTHDHGETRQELTFVPLEALPRELEYLYAK